MVFFAELGITIALGIMLDTFIVRSILVSALTFDIGRRIWWPGRLAGADPALRSSQAAQNLVAAGVQSGPVRSKHQ